MAGNAALMAGYAIGSFLEGRMLMRFGWRKTFLFAMGLPWPIKADRYPSIITKSHEQRAASNFQWTYKHRGASYPEVAGVGCGLEGYHNKD